MRICKILFVASSVRCVVTDESRLAIEGARAVDELARSGRHEEAVRRFEKLVASGEVGKLPTSVSTVALYNHGLSSSEIGEHGLAARAFEACAAALGDDPRRRQVHEKLGDSLAKLRRWPEAAAAYLEAGGLVNAGASLLNAGDARAVEVLRRAAGEAPDHHKVWAYLAAARVRHGDADVSLLERHLSVAPDKVRSALFAAVLLDSEPSQAATRLSISVLERVVPTTHPEASSVYYRLTRLHADAARYASAEATRLGVWVDEFQRPGYLVPGLRAAPWPNLDDVEWSSVATLKRRLEELKPTILAEFRNATNHNFHADEERIAYDATTWRQLTMRKNGTWLPEIAAFRETTVALRELLDDEVADRLPKGSVEISVLEPGARLVPHCGPSNHRIRLHLTLEAPADRSAFIRVGDPHDPSNARHHTPGEVFVFDDSFVHEVANPSQQPRVVLLLDVWHPGLDPTQRETVRQHFELPATSVLWGMT